MNERVLEYKETLEQLEKLLLKIEGWKNRYKLREIISEYKFRIDNIK